MISVSAFVSNWELIAVGIVLNLTVILGFIVFWSKQQSATHRAFLWFSLAIAFWSALNFLSFQPLPMPYSLITLRLTLFAATWFSFSFALFAATFPHERRTLSKLIVVPIYLWTATVSLLTVTPLILQKVITLAADGTIVSVANGPLMPVFGMTTVGYALGGIVLLILNTMRADEANKRRFVWVTTGITAMFFSIVASNFFLPVVFDNSALLPFAAIFTFPFLVLTSYAIIKHRFLDVRVVATEIFVSFLVVVGIVQLAQTRGVLSEIFIQLSMFTGLIVASLLLIRSVLREIEQREVIQIQAQELEIANKQQEGLLHFISHEIKGYLTKSEAAFAAIVGGDYGQITAELQSMSQSALAEMRKGVATIMDILDASNLKKGTVSYAKVSFDFVKAVDEVVHELFASADQKGLSLSFVRPSSGTYTFEGDEDKIRRHVIRNVIDNSIKYTPQGTVRVELTNVVGKIRLAVTDTGVGITKEDMAHLFTEGGHGKDSIKVNVHSTGYGLYIAKQIVEAHGGRIWAESEGAGRGSRFIVEFPLR
ncbi:MAG TPA: ATP-binding protein [Candidatus Paceibacterota bacterium]